jgi:hypothetical protein
MECSRIKSLARYHSNQDEMNARAKVRNKRKYASDPRHRKQRIEYARERRQAPGFLERQREYDRRRRAGMTDDERLKWREYARRYQLERHRNSPKARLERSMSGGIYKSLVHGAKGGRGWEILVGYNLQQLMRHLEKHFLPGMTWDNYGRGGWHIDHKIPKSAFNYAAPEHEDFKRCWALTNLQPLWERENISKGDKLSGPFQPTLAI